MLSRFLLGHVMRGARERVEGKGGAGVVHMIFFLFFGAFGLGLVRSSLRCTSSFTPMPLRMSSPFCRFGGYLTTNRSICMCDIFYLSVSARLVLPRSGTPCLFYNMFGEGVRIFVFFVHLPDFALAVAQLWPALFSIEKSLLPPPPCRWWKAYDRRRWTTASGTWTASTDESGKSHGRPSTVRERGIPSR